MSEHSIRFVPELWPVVSALTVFHSTKKLLDKVWDAQIFRYTVDRF